MLVNERTTKKLKIAVLQRVIPSYRKSLFKELTNSESIEARLFIGEDVPNSKVKSSYDLNGIKYVKLKTKFLKLFGRPFVWHVGLISQLRKYAPDVILCEGESHFLGYIQAILYKFLYKKKTGLLHWCFISLPGEKLKNFDLFFFIKSFFRLFFDAFVVYSGYSKDCLLRLNCSNERIFVATNVGNIKENLSKADSILESKEALRLKLGLRNKFTVLYLGTLDGNKRPDIVLDVAAMSSATEIDFLILGSGPLYDHLDRRIKNENLTNVFLLGRIEEDLPFYCKATDVLIVPGRGGIVISEAMAYALPIIVYQCDGTEYDLIQDGINGFKISNDSAISFYTSIEYLMKNREQSMQMGQNSRKMIETDFTTENMVKKITAAAEFANKKI